MEKRSWILKRKIFMSKIFEIKFIVLILIIFCVKCNGKNDYTPKIDQDYLSHFPKKCELIKKIMFTPHRDSKSNKGFYLRKTCKVDNVLRLIDDFGSKAINKNQNDYCVYEINRSDIKDKLEYCDKEILLIPNFFQEADYFTKGSTFDLPKDFTIYVLELKKGKFIESVYLSDSLNMPDNWKHGLTKGVAISKKRNVAIYYLDIW